MARLDYRTRPPISVSFESSTTKRVDRAVAKANRKRKAKGQKPLNRSTWMEAICLKAADRELKR